MRLLTSPAGLIALGIAFSGGAWGGLQLLGSDRAIPASASASDLFACPSAYHHDGDNIRCAGGPNSRLYSIDAPEMPGSCRPGRDCTPGDPYAARDHLRAITAGKSVECRQLETDHYGRPILQCFAGSVDLSCRMVADGFAVERYGRLECGR